MSDELTKAREALAAFTAESREIVDGRFRGTRKSAPMNRVLPGAVGYLATALRDVDRLTAALAEAEATLANERGEGEPPHPSFKWDVGAGYEGAWQSTVIRDAEGWPVAIRRFLPTRWTFDGGRTSHPTARAAMKAALGAAKEKV